MSNLKYSAYFIATLIACACATASVTAQQISSLSHREILTYLLQADMALQRNMPEVALDNYLIVAKYTNDPKVAQLATETAIQAQLTDKALESAEIWARAQPEDLQAQLIATTLFVAANQDNKAVVFLNNAFKIANPDIDQHLIIILNQLPTETQKNLVSIVLKIAKQRDDDPYAQLSAAQLSAMQMDITNASTFTKTALKLKPDLTSAIELNAKIIRYKANSDQPALSYLEQQVHKFPKNAQLRLFLVTALLDNEQATKALPHLIILTKDKEFGGAAYLTLGEIYINENKISQAEETIKKALKFANSENKAKFYLAQLAEHKKDNKQAIKYYEDIDENSEYHTQGFLRAAYLYALAGNYDDALDILQNTYPSSFEEQKQVLLTEIDILIEAKNLDKAIDNCNKVLSIIPDDPDFLYARSIIYATLKKYAEAEKDLLDLLAIDPNNANALNSLGFILIGQTNRINEAMPYLQKALIINPENPVFMDSMGWLLFKLGRVQEAITLLEKAYKISGDSEIAAHLGEALWKAGEKDSAKQIWNQALASSQDPKTINDTLHRLNIKLNDIKSSNLNKASH